jgi:hypothetical protein
VEKAEPTQVTAATADRRNTSHGTARDRQGNSQQHGVSQTVIHQGAWWMTSICQAAGLSPHRTSRPTSQTSPTGRGAGHQPAEKEVKCYKRMTQQQDQHTQSVYQATTDRQTPHATAKVRVNSCSNSSNMLDRQTDKRT